MQARHFFDEPPAEPASSAASEPSEQRAETTPPVPAAATIAPAVVFHAVSEHDDVGEEAHRPARRRHRDHAPQAEQPPALQMVETLADAPSATIPTDEEPRRRTRPRRRRGGEVPNEPLMLVETQPGAEGARSDNQS